MKKMLKVTFGTMLAVSSVVSSIACAHQHHDYEHFANHFAVWVEGTYTKPSNNGLTVGDQLFATSPATYAGNGNLLDGGYRQVFINPKDRFDYALGLSYRFPHTHSRLFFAYDHYKPRVDTDGQVDVRNLGLQPGFSGVLGVAAPGATQGVAQYDLISHEFRVGAVHDLHLGDHFCLDLLAFLEYDKVRQTLDETNSKNGATFVRETENKVRGFGPGVGFMTRWYARHPNWHIFAGANTTLIAADNDYHQSYFGPNNAIPGSAVLAQTFYIYEPERSHSLVGKLDINFGIDYHCVFRHQRHGVAWDIALGMRYMNMFNAFKNGNAAFNPAAEVTPALEHIAPASFAANLGPAQDWGRWGPFLKFKLGGANS